MRTKHNPWFPLITAVVDVADGHAPWAGETGHVPQLASVALLWLLVRSHGSAAPGT